MSSITSKIDMTRARRKLDRWRAMVRQEEEESVRDYGNIYCGQAFDYTPPGGKYYKGTEAKNRQENRIRWDILGDEYGTVRYYRRGGLLHGFCPMKGYKVSPFIALTKRAAKGVQIVDPATHLRQFGFKRRAHGKYLDWRGPRAFALKTAMMAEYRRRIRTVGRLAAGWVPAARYCGRKTIPGWISRNDRGEGYARIVRSQGHGCEIEIVNTVPYHQTVTQDLMDYVLNRVVSHALQKRARNREKHLIAKMKKAA